VIGGADGLNAAGATTAITEADCSACDDTWCIHLDATDNDGGFDFVYAGTWVSGQGLQSVSAVIGGVLRQIIEGQFPLGGTFHVVKIQWAVDYVAGHQQAGVVSNGLWSDDFSNTLETGFMPSDTDPDWVNVWEGATDMFNIGFDVQAAHDADDGLGTIKWVEISGTGDKPDLDGWIDCI
jgi:hypothetical protein